jgi:Flp pilus assembly protein TadG
MMKTSAIRRPSPGTFENRPRRHRERGITMVLVAIAMVAIIAMAAMSIDVITLYLAREEAQRSADAAALAAARVLSVSGITSTANPAADPASWTKICGAAGAATQTAQAVAIQNSVGSSAGTSTVTYAAGGSSSTDCSTLPAAFGVNPMVTVQVTRASMPTFFSRIWGNTGNSVSATATAEAFNPSYSGTYSNSGGPPTSITPVEPRCVKPWVVPNHDPLNPGPSGPKYCDETGGPGACRTFVSTANASITNPGISLNGGGANGSIGETLWLVPDCQHNVAGHCQLRGSGQPEANYNSGATSVKLPPNLLYVPGEVGTPVVAVPTCTQGDPYEEAIEGCDQAINYQCGQPNANAVDLTRNPGAGGATTNGVQCLTRQTDVFDYTAPSGQDYLNAFGAPTAYPFQMFAGSSTPIAGMAGNPISSSNSIVSLPIYDSAGATIASNRTTNVTFVGFLQVFINAVDQYGNVNVTILNVVGCSNGSGSVGAPALGSSPVPIRLITPP